MAVLGRRPFRTLVVVAAVAFGIAVRVWLLREPLLGGYFDSDEAVPGLMARHMLHGEFPAFYWGQDYGGSAEVALVSAVFALVGSSITALRFVPLALYAVSALLVWRIGRRTVGEPAATIAALLFWIAPTYLVFRSTREYGYQQMLLVCSLLSVLFALRLAARQSHLDAAVLGVAAGIAWWSSIQAGLVLIPLLAWLAFQRLGTRWITTVVGAYVGAFPWLVWNLRYHWASLHTSSGAVDQGTYVSRLGGFFVDALPTMLGLRVPWTLEWLPTRTVGVTALVALSMAAALALTERPRALAAPLLITIAFPLIYAASSFTADRIEPRYVGLLMPFLCLFLGVLLSKSRVAAVASLAVAGLLCVVGLVRLVDAGGIAAGAPDVRAPARLSPLVDALEREHVTHAWANYWIAYRVTFVTRERIVVAPTEGSNRYPTQTDAVAADPRSAHIFVAGTASEAPERPALLKAGFRRIAAGNFVVYVPAQS